MSLRLEGPCLQPDLQRSARKGGSRKSSMKCPTEDDGPKPEPPDPASTNLSPINLNPYLEALLTLLGGLIIGFLEDTT